jgi:hypothetical protein
MDGAGPIARFRAIGPRRLSRDIPLPKTAHFRTHDAFRAAREGKDPPMILVQFDARVRSDRLIGFYVPTSILPGSTCSFNTTISQTNPDGSSTVYKVFTFTQVVPADRHIVFSVPTDVPLGTFHFTILITVLSTAAAAMSSSLSPDTAAVDGGDGSSTIEVATNVVTDDIVTEPSTPATADEPTAKA